MEYPVHTRGRHLGRALLALGVCLLSGSLSIARVQAAPRFPVYRVGIDREREPFEFVDSGGEVTGFTPALLRDVGGRAGVVFQFIPLDLPDSRSALEDGTVDLVSMIRTSARAERYEFSEPHSQAVLAIFRRGDQPHVVDLESLCGQTAGFQEGHFSLEELKGLSHFDRRMFRTRREGLRQLNGGEITAFICGKRTGMRLAERHGFLDVELAAEGFHPVDFCFAAPRASRHLIELLNRQLVTLRNSGRRDYLAQRWLNEGLSERGWRSESGGPYALLGIVGLFASCLVGFLVWIGLLRRRVRNSARALREREAQLRHSQKLEALGRLAGGVAHNFNNLLTVIDACSEELLAHIGKDAPLRGTVEQIGKATKRSAGLTRQLLAFSRKQVLEFEVVDLKRLVSETGTMLRSTIDERCVLTTDLGPGDQYVRADADQLVQVILNLAMNATDAMPQGGTLTVETRRVDVGPESALARQGIPPGRYALLAVVDTGVGMDEATLSRIFDPFFTAEKEQGSGLGLSTAYGTVRQCEGYITVASEPGNGTTFKVFLPRIETEEAPAPAEEAGGGPFEARKTILLVEDEELIRTLLREALEKYGFTVLEAADPDTALAVLDQRAGPLDILVTDVVMPGMTGPELAERVRRGRPDVRALYISGLGSRAAAQIGHPIDEVDILEKPFVPATLLRKIRDVLSRPAAG